MKLAVTLVLCVLGGCAGGEDAGRIAASPGAITASDSPSIAASAAATRGPSDSPGRSATRQPSAAPRPSPSATARSASAPPGSGVRGVVHAGPTCPVERADSPCPDRTIEATIEIGDRTSGRVAARTTSGGDGRFQAAVQPGEYTISASSKQAMSCAPADVTVSPGRYATADVSCDTGIR